MIGNNVKKPIVLFVIIVIFILILSVNFLKNVTPTITVLCESRAKSIGLKIANETIKDYMDKLEYEQLMNLTYDASGKLSTMSANIGKVNSLSSQIAYTIQEKLLNVENSVVGLPVGRVLGWSIFSGYGPSIKIKLIPVGNVNVSFKTEFISEGINQTRHTIYIQLRTSVMTVAPFISNTVSVENLITVAETIIVGDIPNAYYNIEGVQDLDKVSTLEIVNWGINLE